MHAMPMPGHRNAFLGVWEWAFDIELIEKRTSTVHLHYEQRRALGYRVHSVCEMRCSTADISLPVSLVALSLISVSRAVIREARRPAVDARCCCVASGLRAPLFARPSQRYRWSHLATAECIASRPSFSFSFSFHGRPILVFFSIQYYIVLLIVTVENSIFSWFS